MIKKVFASFAIISFAFVVYAGTAHAAWPGTQWTTDGVPVQLIVEKGFVGGVQVHQRLSTYFSVYYDGDQRGNGSTMQVDFTTTAACDISGAPNIIIKHPGNPGGEPRGSCGPTSIWFTLNNVPSGRVFYDINRDQTEYQIEVDLTDVAAETTTKGYAFTVSSPQEPAAKFGVTPKKEVVFIADKAQGSFTNIYITQQPPCNGGVGLFSSYDYDNFPTSRAQNTANGNNPANYSPMWVTFNPISGAAIPNSGVAPAWDGVSRGWTPGLGGTVNVPHSASGQNDDIVYSTVPNTTYQYVLNNFGRNNFIGLMVPWPGAPVTCPPPQSATLNAFAGGQGKIEAGNNFHYDLWVDASNVVRPGADSFTYKVESSNDNGATWSGLVANSSAQIIGDGRRLTLGYDVNYPSYGRYCYKITITGVPAYATAPTPAAVQCVQVIRRGIYSVDVETAPYEKGTGGETITYKLFMTQAPCGDDFPDDIAWGDITSPGRHTSTDCFTPVPAIGTPLDSFTVVIPASTLDVAPPGNFGPYRAVINNISGAAPAPPTVSDSGPKYILVFEVPFARFSGQDVRVCNDASASRFMWGNVGTWQGSNSRYASIFSGGNAAPANPYDGMRTYLNNLRANWNALSGEACHAIKSAPAPDPFASHVVLPIGSTVGPLLGYSGINVYRAAGDLDITDNITRSGAGNINIYIANNINIHSNVRQIDAVLIATNDIQTCSGVPRNAWVANCRWPLVINGSAYAHRLLLQRSVGTRYLSVNPGAAYPYADDRGRSAEEINYPIDLNFLNLGLASEGKLDNYQTLPPRL